MKISLCIQYVKGQDIRGIKEIKLFVDKNKIDIFQNGDLILSIPEEKFSIVSNIILSEVHPWWRHCLKKINIKMDKSKKLFKSTPVLQSFIAIVNIYSEIYTSENIVMEFNKLSKSGITLYDSKELRNKICILNKKDHKIIPDKDTFKELYEKVYFLKCILNSRNSFYYIPYAIPIASIIKLSDKSRKIMHRLLMAKGRGWGTATRSPI